LGALTAKPYAFWVRSWTVLTNIGYDFFDSCSALIRIDLQGVSVTRILPCLFEEINGEWITDKTRFGFDAQFRHRITSPAVSFDLISFFKKKGKIRFFFKDLIFPLRKPKFSLNNLNDFFLI